MTSPNEVEDFLHSIGLGGYSRQFEALGYDSMDALQFMDEESLLAVIKKPGHLFKFRLRLSEVVFSGTGDVSKGGKGNQAGMVEQNLGGQAGGVNVLNWLKIAALIFLIAFELFFWDTKQDDGGAMEDLPSEALDLEWWETAREEALSNVSGLDAMIVSRVFDALRNDDDTYDRAKFYHLHIPKVGGASFRKEVPRILPSAAVFETLERCYYDPKKSGSHVLTLVRRPRKHALSQYTHCATSGSHNYGKEWVPQSFEEWIFGWYWLRTQNRSAAYCCTNPVNMQAYRMVCEAGSMSSGKQKRFTNDIDVDEAIRNLKEAFFVGVLDAYDESICLLQARIRGILPRYCNCEDPKAWAHRPQLHADAHQIKRTTRLEDLPRETLEVIDDITAIDTALYNEALKRFYLEVGIVEKRFGRRFMCKNLKPLPVAKPAVRSEEWLDVAFKKAEYFVETMPRNSTRKDMCALRYGNLTHDVRPKKRARK